MTDKKDPVNNPLQWLWRTCLLIFGSVLALNLAVAYLEPIMPWIIGAAVVALVLWVAISVIRWRRSRW
jgi:uncharacterized membrane protein YdbT with pleckstrin-like domain